MAFYLFLCFWMLVVGAITWRALQTGQIGIFGDGLAIRRSKNPLLFWLGVLGGVTGVFIGLLTFVPRVIDLAFGVIE